jgi:hypothetical protein
MLSSHVLPKALNIKLLLTDLYIYDCELWLFTLREDLLIKRWDSIKYLISAELYNWRMEHIT